MSELPNALSVREADHPVEPLFLQRWSPRAMSGEALAEDQLMQLFEAARWAPSTYNEQEWRFLYARRDTPHWDAFFHLLAEPNQGWCGDAAVLGVVLSKKTFTRNGKPNPVHTFDAGLAYQNLALQGAAMGLVVHGMAGFDFDKARKELNVPEDFAVEAMFAVGRHGDPADLPEELREREEPSGRKPVGEIICEGPFAF
ncbi:nitroreductase family protein [Alienimonas californiensis]|uniref:Malonic semialdehyde reductase n=1 Tax=Alienimonas californiensis TaxID=2527989 RepID=A0A517P712_9PLAN|nr:nitroreductase family protein [Alienimonas californiensis]QDT15154.1 malonic semialdehyde reductase [Alienimonas californiensis]